MALIPVDNVGQVGIVKDINPWQLPPNVWSDGNNVRAEHGAILKSPGYAEVMSTCPIVPLYITNLNTAADNYWIVAGTAAIHVYKDSTDAWANITRSSGIYHATAEENWTSTVLGGVLILANGFDDPQFWALTNGDLVMTITNGAGTTTPNTDIKAYIARDGSDYTTAVTLVDQGDTGGHTILTANLVDLSGETSGTSMRWKITTHNQSASKTTRIQAVSLGWS